MEKQKQSGAPLSETLRHLCKRIQWQGQMMLAKICLRLFTDYIQPSIEVEQPFCELLFAILIRKKAVVRLWTTALRTMNNMGNTTYYAALSCFLPTL
jgi:hypothetical protein